MNIFLFSDYHRFLAEKIKEMRTKDSSLSYRKLAKICEVKSPSFLQDVAAGKKVLSVTGAKKVAIGLALNPSESEYLILLVKFESAEEGSEKAKVKKEIQKFLRKNKAVNIDQLVTKFYSDWTHVVVREWVSTHPSTFELISKDLSGLMSSSKVKESLQLLSQIGIVQYENDIYSVDEAPLFASGNIEPSVIKNYAKSMIQLGLSSMDTVPWELREITSLTLSFDVKRIEEAKERIAEFKAAFGAEFDADRRSNSVYQCNIQLFPTFVKKSAI